MAFLKRESFEYYDSQFAKIRQTKLEIEKKLADIEVREQSILARRRDFGIKKYASTKVRERIISEAEDCGYSSTAIVKLKKYHGFSWDQDNITNEIIDEFNDAATYIRQQKPYKDSVLYKLGDIFGGSEDED